MPMIRKKLLRNPRMKLNPLPQWPGSVEGFVVNYLKANYWRVESTMSYDDAMQEAHVVFLRCKRKYSVEEPKHFMALFKTSLVRVFADLSKLDSEIRAMVSLQQEDEGGESIVFEAVGDLDNNGGIIVALDQAPSEIKEVLQLLLTAPLEILELARNCWKSNGRNVEEGNAFINESLGRMKGTDSIGAVQQYFM